MAKASRSVVINVPRDFFFEVVTDYAKYPEFLPEVKDVILGAVRDAKKQVTYEIELVGRRIKYTLNMIEEKPRRVSWEFMKGDLMKDNNGSWELEAEGDARTRATYNIELKISPLIPSSLTTKIAEINLPTMLSRFRERAEKLFSEGRK